MCKARTVNAANPAKCVNNVHVTAMVANVPPAKSAQTVLTARTCVSQQPLRLRWTLRLRLHAHRWRKL